MRAMTWLKALGAVTLLAGAIQASSSTAVTGKDGGFSATAVDPAAAAQPQNGGGSGPPPGSDPNAFAGAAGAAGFKPVNPGQALDLGQVQAMENLPEGVRFISFHTLGGFLYESDMEAWTDPFEQPKRRAHPKRVVPPAVQALDGRRIAAVGFMLPFDFKQDGTRHFGLMRNQVGCCFGMAPGLNEWVDVDVPVKPALVYMDTPIMVVGKLSIKPIVEAGTTMGLYHLVAESVGVAKIPELKR